MAVPMGGCHPWLRHGVVALRGCEDSQPRAPRHATVATHSEAGGGEASDGAGFGSRCRQTQESQIRGELVSAETLSQESGLAALSPFPFGCL